MNEMFNIGTSAKENTKVENSEIEPLRNYICKSTAAAY